MTREINPDLIRLFEAQWPLMRELHAQGSLAPCAIWMDPEGTLHGEAFIVDDVEVEPPGAEWVVRHFGSRYRQGLDAKEMRAAGVFFHGETRSGYVEFASAEDYANAIVGMLEHRDGEATMVVLLYRPSDSGWQYGDPGFYPSEGFPPA